MRTRHFSGPASLFKLHQAFSNFPKPLQAYSDFPKPFSSFIRLLQAYSNFLKPFQPRRILHKITLASSSLFKPAIDCSISFQPVQGYDSPAKVLFQTISSFHKPSRPSPSLSWSDQSPQVHHIFLGPFQAYPKLFNPLQTLPIFFNAHQAHSSYPITFKFFKPVWVTQGFSTLFNPLQALPSHFNLVQPSPSHFKLIQSSSSPSKPFSST